MIDDDADLERKYRSPRVFGPMPGPRNIPLSYRDRADLPDEVTTALSVSLEADPVELSRLLPSDSRLSGAAVLTVTATRLENLRWLAGRGYQILTVTFPIAHIDGVEGRFLAVLWESLADPVTTGREELGFPKLPADIRAPGLADISPTGGVDADASWDGFRFCDVTAEGLRDGPRDRTPGTPPKGTFVHRFVPAPGAPDRADVDELLFYAAPAGPSTVTDTRSGTGRFRFHPARFEDVPVQYPVINALAALSLAASGPATLTRSIGAPGGSAPRRLGLHTTEVSR